jgi:hypothetical protein
VAALLPALGGGDRTARARRQLEAIAARLLPLVAGRASSPESAEELGRLWCEQLRTRCDVILLQATLLSIANPEAEELPAGS